MVQAMFARAISLAFLIMLSACVAPQGPVPAPSSGVMEAARDAAASPVHWAQECKDWDVWEKRAPAFRIHGNTYHVGTCGITAIFIAGPSGHVLIDTGTANGSRQVLTNIRVLGFQPENINAILTSHEHFDHVGGLWWVHQNTGAPIITSTQARGVIVSGAAHAQDPQAGMHPPMRPLPAQFVSTAPAGQPLNIAGLDFTPVETPGHTPGALSWQWESCEGSECVTIVYADSLSAVSRSDYRFSDHPDYVQAYRDGLARLATLKCDILLTPHPSASGMRDKLLTGDLASGMDCAEYAAHVEARLDTRIAEEANAS